MPPVGRPARWLLSTTAWVHFRLSVVDLLCRVSVALGQHGPRIARPRGGSKSPFRLLSGKKTTWPRLWPGMSPLAPLAMRPSVGHMGSSTVRIHTCLHNHVRYTQSCPIYFILTQPAASSNELVRHMRARKRAVGPCRLQLP